MGGFHIAIGAGAYAARQYVRLWSEMCFIAPGIEWEKFTSSKLPVLGKNRNQLGNDGTNNLKVGILVNRIARQVGGETLANIHTACKPDIAINNKNFSMATQIGIGHAHAPGVGHKKCGRNAFSP